MRVEQFIQLGQIYLLIQISHLPKKRNKVLEKMKVFEMQKWRQFWVRITNKKWKGGFEIQTMRNIPTAGS